MVAAVQHAAHVHAGRHAHCARTLRVAVARVAKVIGPMGAARRAPRHPLHVRVAHHLYPRGLCKDRRASMSCILNLKKNHLIFGVTVNVAIGIQYAAMLRWH